MDSKQVIQQLNAPDKQTRLNALRAVKGMIDAGEIETAPVSVYTNNHVHTTYSFSPYSPSKTLYMAKKAGLSTVGILDHDSMSGAKEFIEAGEIMEMPITIGFEMRVSYLNTPLEGRRINNPDQISSAYIAAHGVPHSKIDEANAFLENVRQARNQRNRRMIDKLNVIAAKAGISIDYNADVLPISQAASGGGVTERHLLFAFTHKLIDKFGKGQPLLDALTGTFGLTLAQKQKEMMLDDAYEYYDYDVLNVLKGGFVSEIYIDANEDEMVPVKQAVDFIKRIGAIPSYCYLGDVGASPTGDKKEQKFEDDYLEEVLDLNRDIGFAAIAFMPSRNTAEQLLHLMPMLEERGFFQISGEDINQPRQSFICKQLTDEKYIHLIDTTWALIGHEMEASADITRGMFYGGIAADQRELEDKIDRYMAIAKGGQAT